MGTDLLPGHVYVDNQLVNGPSLTEHVSEATIKPTFYSSKTAKSPVTLTDEFLIRDTVADAYRKVTLASLQALMVGSGTVINAAYGEYTVNSNLTAVIPTDDTVPQNTEGTEIVNATITPRFANSLILVRFQGVFSAAAALTGSAALFRDAAVPALCATSSVSGAANWQTPIGFEMLDSASSTSPITYKVRAGPNTAGTIRFNGNSAARFFGGVFKTTLFLQEIKQ